MKRKTINIVCCGVFDRWLESIEDESVRNLVKNKVIMTGGAIASMLSREPVKDFDFYFEDIEAAKAAATYYVDQFVKNPPTRHKGSQQAILPTVEVLEDRVRIVIKSAGVASEDGTGDYQYFEGVQEGAPDNAESYVQEVMAAVDAEGLRVTDTTAEDERKFRPVFMSENAITLANKVQLVFRFIGPADKIHENYDFVHCTNYWTSRDRKLFLNEPAVTAVLTKELRYVGSKYPVCSLFRIRKFVQRGYTINAGQILKIALQVGDLDLKNPVVLKDQLTGVDVAYFMQVIALLQAKHDKEVAEGARAADDMTLDRAYLIEIIDRMF